MSHESPNRIAGKEHVMEQSTWTRLSHVRWMMTATATRQWKPVQVTPLPRKNLEQTRPAADTRRFTINRGPPTVYNISSLGT
ncbi:hypothetical protein OUZ56_008909 [Daphnia magna]|uniref:Uncharacterized protein n=1 Tax=Daphnia magna TaxID=35525 RepID=A0ABR0AET4_9CRUS|nr:hypothetical protein OUZ56_008909 [Daphnia magna]